MIADAGADHSRGGGKGGLPRRRHKVIYRSQF